MKKDELDNDLRELRELIECKVCDLKREYNIDILAIKFDFEKRIFNISIFDNEVN